MRSLTVGTFNLFIATDVPKVEYLHLPMCKYVDFDE